MLSFSIIHKYLLHCICVKPLHLKSIIQIMIINVGLKLLIVFYELLEPIVKTPFVL